MLIREKLGRRPSVDDIGRRRREMSARRVFVSEGLVGRHRARTGYARKFPAPAWRPAFALSRRYCPRPLPVLAFPAKKLWQRRRWRRQDQA
jgi:hypothetical protein